jgi:hypothetical protein
MIPLGVMQLSVGSIIRDGQNMKRFLLEVVYFDRYERMAFEPSRAYLLLLSFPKVSFHMFKHFSL